MTCLLPYCPRHIPMSVLTIVLSGLPSLYFLFQLLRASPFFPVLPTPAPNVPYIRIAALSALPPFLSFFSLSLHFALPIAFASLFATLLTVRYAHQALPADADSGNAYRPIAPHSLAVGVCSATFLRFDVTLLYSTVSLLLTLAPPAHLWTRLVCLGLAVLSATAFLSAVIHRFRLSTSPVSADLLLRSLLPPLNAQPDALRPAPPNPWNASAFTLLSFDWMTATVSAGRVRPLEEDDVIPLTDKFTCLRTGRHTFQPKWRDEVGESGTGVPGTHPSLFRALTKSFGIRLGLSVLLKIGNDVCLFVSPMVLRLVCYLC